MNGLLNGQSLDLRYSELYDRENDRTRRPQHSWSPIRLTLVLPSMLGGATPREVQLFERIATCWGLAYQMVDDLKDVMQSSVESGKTAARDLDLDRPNIALAIGVPDALSAPHAAHRCRRPDSAQAHHASARVEIPAATENGPAA